MHGVLFIGGHVRFAGEAHDEADIETVIDNGALAGDGGAGAEVLDELDLGLEFPCAGEERGAVSSVAGTLQPDEDDVLDFAFGGGFLSNGAGGACAQKKGGGSDEDESGVLHDGG